MLNMASHLQIPLGEDNAHISDYEEYGMVVLITKVTVVNYERFHAFSHMFVVFVLKDKEASASTTKKQQECFDIRDYCQRMLSFSFPQHSTILIGTYCLSHLFGNSSIMK